MSDRRESRIFGLTVGGAAALLISIAGAETLLAIALLGWLNRWVQTVATPLEASALAFANEHLAPSGWTPSPHAR